MKRAPTHIRIYILDRRRTKPSFATKLRPCSLLQSKMFLQNCLFLHHPLSSRHSWKDVVLETIDRGLLVIQRPENHRSWKTRSHSSRQSSGLLHRVSTESNKPNPVETLRVSGKRCGHCGSLKPPCHRVQVVMPIDINGNGCKEEDPALSKDPASSEDGSFEKIVIEKKWREEKKAKSCQFFSPTSTVIPQNLKPLWESCS